MGVHVWTKLKAYLQLMWMVIDKSVAVAGCWLPCQPFGAVVKSHHELSVALTVLPTALMFSDVWILNWKSRVSLHPAVCLALESQTADAQEANQKSCTPSLGFQGYLVSEDKEFFESSLQSTPPTQAWLLLGVCYNATVWVRVKSHQLLRYFFVWCFCCRIVQQSGASAGADL